MNKGASLPSASGAMMGAANAREISKVETTVTRAKAFIFAGFGVESM